MNASTSTPSAQLAASLARFPADIVALAKRCLPKLRRALPGANQLVYTYSSSVVVAFGMSERGYEAVVALAVDKRGVRLYLDKSLPDPTGLLKGSGTKVRNVAIEKATDLDRADIKALIKGAIEHADVTLTRTTRSTRTIIKTKPKKRKTSKAKRG